MRVVDRSKDMILHGGENVAPTEVEAVLHNHPAVLQVQMLQGPAAGGGGGGGEAVLAAGLTSWPIPRQRL